MKQTEPAVQISQTIECHSGLDLIVQTPEMLEHRLKLGDRFLLVLLPLVFESHISTPGELALGLLLPVLKVAGLVAFLCLLGAAPVMRVSPFSAREFMRRGEDRHRQR